MDIQPRVCVCVCACVCRPRKDNNVTVSSGPVRRITQRRVIASAIPPRPLLASLSYRYRNFLDHATQRAEINNTVRHPISGRSSIFGRCVLAFSLSLQPSRSARLITHSEEPPPSLSLSLFLSVIFTRIAAPIGTAARWANSSWETRPANREL